MMALNYGVGAEHTAPHKGYSDFVQHTGPMLSGQLGVSLSDAQTLPVTFGYSQDQAANMQSAKNSLKMFQRTKLSFAQILCNSLRVAQASCNSLMGVDYNESLEMARHGGSPSSEAPRKFVATCTPGMRKISHTPNQQIAGEEKGRTANPTLWDACFFNHQENQYFAEPQDNHTEISGEVKPWCCVVLQKFRKTSTGATYESFVGHRVTDRKSVQTSGSSLDFLRCLRLISPCMAVTINCPVVSPSSFTDSIASTTSCGARACTFCDFALTAFVATDEISLVWWRTVYTKNKPVKCLTCLHLENKVEDTLIDLRCENSEAQKDGNPIWASNHNVIGANTMACQHSTQTRPKFVYLFLASYPSGGKPIMLRTEANSELEARLRIAGDYSLTFAAQIRTESPCVIHRHCEEADLTSTYICNKADAHPVCNAGKNSFCVNPYQPRPEAHHV